MIFLVAALLLLPIVELAVMVQVGTWLGVLQTIALVVLVSLFGAWMVKRQGIGAWRRVRDDLARGRVPSHAIFDGGLLMLAGVLFLIPGFVTDVFAVLLLMPPVRNGTRAVLARRYRVLSTVAPPNRAPRGSVYDADSTVREPGRSAPPELEA